jgi:transcription antitermination factor NusG
MREGFPWYALIVKSRLEIGVGRWLQKAGFPSYVPARSETRQWSDRRKVVDVPLFPGYVFCRFDISHRLPILTIPAVKGIVGTSVGPEAIPHSEIETIQRIVTSRLNCYSWPYLERGELVRVRLGSLAGLEGIFLDQRNGSRVIVSIELLQRSVAVEIDRENVEPVRETARRLPDSVPPEVLRATPTPGARALDRRSATCALRDPRGSIHVTRQRRLRALW